MRACSFSALADDGDDGDRVRGSLCDERLMAPHPIDPEVVSACRRLADPGAGGWAGAARAAGPACWELRANLTVHDASHVAVAEAIDAMLLMSDRRLAEAPGVRGSVEVRS